MSRRPSACDGWAAFLLPDTGVNATPNQSERKRNQYVAVGERANARPHVAFGAAVNIAASP